MVQNGLNLLGVSPYAFRMVIGLTILAAISLSNVGLVALLGGGEGRGHAIKAERVAMSFLTDRLGPCSGER